MVAKGITEERWDTMKTILHDCIMETKQIIEQQKAARDEKWAAGDKRAAGMHDASCLKLNGMLEAYEFCQLSAMKIEKGELG